MGAYTIDVILRSTWQLSYQVCKERLQALYGDAWYFRIDDICGNLEQEVPAGPSAPHYDIAGIPPIDITVDSSPAGCECLNRWSALRDYADYCG